jgi:hypothetical protein
MFSVVTRAIAAAVLPSAAASAAPLVSNMDSEIQRLLAKCGNDAAKLGELSAEDKPVATSSRKD